jgi:dihydroorotase
MKPISHSKHHHRKEKQTRLLFQEEDRLIPVHSNPDPNHTHHRLQIQQMRRELTQALSNIRYIAEHCSNQSLIESIRDEWKFIATVIDRLQFVIFLTVTLSGSLALLFQVDNFI